MSRVERDREPLPPQCPRDGRLRRDVVVEQLRERELDAREDLLDADRRDGEDESRRFREPADERPLGDRSDRDRRDEADDHGREEPPLRSRRSATRRARTRPRRGRPARSSRCGSRDRSARVPSRRAPTGSRARSRGRGSAWGPGTGSRRRRRSERAERELEAEPRVGVRGEVDERSTICSTRRFSAVKRVPPRTPDRCTPYDRRRWGYSLSRTWMVSCALVGAWRAVGEGSSQHDRT